VVCAIVLSKRLWLHVLRMTGARVCIKRRSRPMSRFWRCCSKPVPRLNTNCTRCVCTLIIQGCCLSIASVPGRAHVWDWCRCVVIGSDHIDRCASPSSLHLYKWLNLVIFLNSVLIQLQQTPLILATSKNQIKGVAALLLSGADVHATQVI